MTEAAGHHRVVVGVDGSPESVAALRWAVDEARVHGGEVRVVHAWMLPYRGLAQSYTPEPYGLPDPELVRQGAQRVLDDLLRGVDDTAGVTVHGELREGQAAAVLLALAYEADLLVVGSRGHGGFGSLLLGSVSAQVVRHAPCTVVVVRPPR